MGAELPVEAHCVRGERKGRRRAKNTICNEVCVCVCLSKLTSLHLSVFWSRVIWVWAWIWVPYFESISAIVSPSLPLELSLPACLCVSVWMCVCVCVCVWVCVLSGWSAGWLRAPSLCQPGVNRLAAPLQTHQDWLVARERWERAQFSPFNAEIQAPGTLSPSLFVLLTRLFASFTSFLSHFLLSSARILTLLFFFVQLSFLLSNLSQVY